jgi:hypothetical protein
MEKNEIEGPKPPIGFLSSLWRGVETVNSHPDLLIIPILLDALLWFGPRLSINELISPLLQSLQSAVVANGGDPSNMVAIRQWASSFNLLSFLSFLPLYPPSLMAFRAPAQSPLGLPEVVQINNPLSLVALAAGFFLLSILIGSIYWVEAGRAALEKAMPLREIPGRLIRAVTVMLTLSFTLGIFVFGLLMIVIFFGSLLALVWPSGIALFLQLIFFMGGGSIFWIFLFVVFSVHGAILHRDNLLRSIWNSIETSRWMYPLSMWIPILLIGLYLLTINIWSLPKDNNWIGFLAVLGNAYTGSVLVTASIAYYREKRRWIEEIRSLLQSRGIAPKTLFRNN